MSIKKSSRIFRGLLILALVIGTWLCVQLSRPRSIIARLPFSSGVEIIVYEDNFWEVSCPVAYEIRRRGQIVVPLTYFTSYVDRRPGNFKSALSSDASLYAVWPSSASRRVDGPIIMFHLPTGESWPRHRGDEASYTASVRHKWGDRLALLQKECPPLLGVKLD